LEATDKVWHSRIGGGVRSLTEFGFVMLARLTSGTARMRPLLDFEKGGLHNVSGLRGGAQWGEFAEVGSRVWERTLPYGNVEAAVEPRW